MLRYRLGSLCCGWLLAMVAGAAAAPFHVERITHGPQNHFFGYIGHGMTIPWNASGRYIVALRTDFHDRMPKAGETADVVLIDTQQGHQLRVVDRTRAWNLQQGTMLYWNPQDAEHQFFFNDVDPDTGVVFTALYDVRQGKRVRTYRFGNESIANGGVAPSGQYFAGINYGKISRIREVISYPGTSDASAAGPANPTTDGLFRVDVSSGERKLLVSYQQLSDLLLDTPKNRERLGDPEKYPIYVHHTLWNRSSEWIAFIVRGGLDKRPNAGCAVRVDGTGLRKIPFAGHPEWLSGTLFAMASKEDGAFNLYDVTAERWSGQLGAPGVFPDTNDDNALSPDRQWFVGSHRPSPQACVYTIFHIADGRHVRTPAVPTKSGGGLVRLDSAPRWNRTNDGLLVPGLAEDGTVQLFVVRWNQDSL